jgi:phosphatidylserine decarboxylase
MSVIASIRGQLVPIRREGYPFIAVFAVASVLLSWVWGPLGTIGLLATLWVMYFFRDPPRVTPLADGLVVAPADGRISLITHAVPPAELALGEALLPRISIFMSVFDCHVNRSPVGGRIERMVYRPGKFINAELDKASEHNERNALVIDAAGTRVGVVQIAGLIARRIVPFVREGDVIGAGERIGMIRFGSRLDVYLPQNSKLLVGQGQIATAGETVLAELGAGEGTIAYRVS